MALPVGVDVAGAHNGSRNVVAVVALAGTAEVGRDSSLEVDVGLDVAVVAVADHYAGAAVVASAGERHADRRRSVVFGSDEVFGLARSLFRLYKLHFGKRGNALQVTRVDPNTDSVGCGRDDRADAVEVR